jgi:branched-chain amino acid transport system substrate-binding protein
MQFSRDRVSSACSKQKVALSWLLPGVTLNTSPTDYQPIKEMHEMRFNGKTWGVTR